MKTWQFVALYCIFMAFVLGYVALSKTLSENHDAKVRQQVIQEVCK